MNPDFFLGPRPNQTLLNIFERSDQGSVKLDRSFNIVLTKYQEPESHDVIVHKLHLGELDTSVGCTSIGYYNDQLDLYIYVFFFHFQLCHFYNIWHCCFEKLIENLFKHVFELYNPKIPL